MKTRNGFVSNSSSSSYIVKIKDISFNDFCERLQVDYSWNEFNLKMTCGMIKRRIKDINKLRKQKKYKHLFDSYDKHKETLEALEKEGLKILMVDDIDFVKAVAFILEYNDIKCVEVDGDVQLDYFTSMHNCFDEGIGGLFKEILLFFMFDTHYKVECEREDHN